MDENSTWKSVLSILGFIVLFVKLIFTCSNSNSNSTANIQNTEDFQNTQQIMQESLELQRKMQHLAANNILYKTYPGLDSLSVIEKENYGLKKLEKDSLVYIDLTTQISIPKNYYIQNNHDNLMRMAFKSPDHLNIFIHDLESKDDMETNLKSLKSGGNLEKFKTESTIGDIKTFSYKITRENTKYNGYALCFKEKEFQDFFEFESDKFSIAELKLKGIEFLARHSKEKK